MNRRDSKNNSIWSFAGYAVTGLAVILFIVVWTRIISPNLGTVTIDESADSGQPKVANETAAPPDRRTGIFRETSDPKSRLSVPFPGYDPVVIRLKKPAADKHPRPNELMMNFEFYRELARKGDSEVAVKLYNAMQTCELLAPDTKEELEKAVSELYQTHRWPILGGQQSMDLPGETDFHDAADRLRQIAENCWQVTDEVRVEAFTWVETAAKSDYLPALSIMGNLKRGTGNETEIYEKMWQLGRVHALSLLSQTYRRELSEGQPNLIKSYAYAYLHSHIRMLDHSLNGGSDAQQKISSRRNYLRSLEMRMQPYQVDEGQAVARMILQDNPNCCLSWYKH